MIIEFLTQKKNLKLIIIKDIKDINNKYICINFFTELTFIYIIIYSKFKLLYIKNVYY